MEFSLYFLRVLFVDLLYASPILLFLVVLISFVGHIVGRFEGWSRSDALYHAFINATTVGYGDFSTHVLVANNVSAKKNVRSSSDFQACTIVRRSPPLWKAVRLLRPPGIQD